MEFDTDRLISRVLEALISQGNSWLSFRQLAYRVTGDISDADLIGAVVESRPDAFVVHADRRCKIRSELLETAGRIEVPTAGTHEPVHLQAARAVREYARQLSSLRVSVVGCDKGKSVLDRFLHALHVEIADDDIRFSDDTPVELVSPDGRRNPGHIAGTSRDEALLYVAFQYEVLPVDVPAWIEVSRSKPLHNLADYLSSLTSHPHLATALYAQAPDSHPLQHEDSKVIALGLQELKIPWSRLLWGPPGAGKTYCAAQLAAALLGDRADERILLVTPSNVAVDTALSELIDALESREDGKRLISNRLILRYGYPRDDRISSRPELFGPTDMEPLSREIYSTQMEIRHLTQKRAPESEVAEARTRLRQLQTRRKNRIAEHLGTARVVATTVAGAFTGISPVIGALRWHTLIADEASMLSGATVLALAALAEERYLLVGDPRQLAPIFEWRRQSAPSGDVQRWLSQDPYELASLSVGSGWAKTIRTDDARMARIMAQRRCHPRIWSLVKGLYPAVNSLTDTVRLSRFADVPPLPGQPAVLLDLSRGRIPRNEIPETDSAEDLKINWESACRKVGQTWENPPTAMLAIDVARDIRSRVPDASIAIIAPYRGQVNLIRRWLHGERQIDPKLDRIEIGTVHSFQGGEADVVIFDMVDGPPRQRPGILFRDDTGMRLVNVATTRARGKLVLIAHKDWVGQSEPGRLGVLWHILFGSAARPQDCTVLPPRSSEEISESSQSGGVPESPIEELMVAELRRRQRELPPFTLQYRITDEHGKIVSRADVAFVGDTLSIFCDGARYHLQHHQWQRDLRQRRELSRLGWTVLAFTGSEINADPGSCVEQIIRTIATRRK